MVVRLDQLEGYILALQKCLHRLGCNIVHNVKGGLVPLLLQVRDLLLEYPHQGFALGVLDGLEEDGVGRPIIQDEDGCHAIYGAQGEGPCKVCIDGAMLGVHLVRDHKDVILLALLLGCLWG